MRKEFKEIQLNERTQETLQTIDLKARVLNLESQVALLSGLVEILDPDNIYEFDPEKMMYRKIPITSQDEKDGE